jgi:hypothetical protein
MARMSKQTASILMLVLCLLLGPRYFTQTTPRTPKAVPRFEVDPSWPKTKPDNWVWGGADVLGINADVRDDHVWVTTRGQIAEFDPDGKLLQVWNAQGEGRKWTTIHGLFLDHNNFIWTTGREQHQILKYTRDGKLLMTIGKFSETAGSNDTERLGRPAEVYVTPDTNELFVVDGYTNRRVIVFDAATGKYLRHWGAYGKTPDDKARNLPDPTPPPQFNIPHGITGSHDGLIYASDRTNSRVQVFKRNGEFVKEGITRPGTGGAFSVALSHDPEQEFVYVCDGTQHRIWILRRETMEVAGQFSHEGREVGELGRPHNITVDSKGNIYVSEGDPGRRAQKFTFKGWGS